MTIEVRDGGHYLAGWFISGNDCDWLAAMYRLDGGPWRLVFRFRYYANTGIDRDDEKSWSSYTAPLAERDKMLRAADAMANAMRDHGFMRADGSCIRVLVDGGPREFDEKFLRLLERKSLASRTDIQGALVN